jgi:hypothetical protein
MGLARLRAEVARPKMERDILEDIRRGATLPKGQTLRAKVYTGNAEASGRPVMRGEIQPLIQSYYSTAGR